MRASCLISVCLAAAAPASAHAQRLVVPRNGDVCTDELEDVLRQWFGPRAKVTWHADVGITTPMWARIARTNLCDGLIQAQYVYSANVCIMPHYGGAPPGLIAAFGYGSCAALLGGASIYRLR